MPLDRVLAQAFDPRLPRRYSLWALVFLWLISWPRRASARMRVLSVGGWLLMGGVGLGLLVGPFVVAPPTWAQDQTRIVDGNTRFHRLYVLGNGTASERAAWEDDLGELRNAVEAPGRQANGSTSRIVRQPTLAQMQAAITGVLGRARAGDEVTLYFSGHGGGGARYGIRNNPAEAGEPDSFDEHFDGVLSDDEFARLLLNTPADVTVISIFDSCFGGGFTGGSADVAEGARNQVIGVRGTCSTDPPGVLGGFVDTLTEEVAARARRGGTVSGTDLKNHLTAEGFELGAPTDGDRAKSKKGKCATPGGGPCEGLPTKTHEFVAPGRLSVSGENFSPGADGLVELFLADQSLLTLGSFVVDELGRVFGEFPFPSSVTAPFLISVSDELGFNDFNVVPAPAALELLALGLVAFVYHAARRRSRAAEVDSSIR